MAVDHVANALARLPQRWKDKPNMVATITALVTPFQSIEDACQQLLVGRSVLTDDTIGQQLDDIGEVVGQPRNGVSDDDLYRRYLRARIRANRSLGRIEDLIAIARIVLYDALARVVVDNQGVATVVVRITGVAVSNDVAELLIGFLRAATKGGGAAGVRVILETSTETTANVFQWDTAGRGWDNAAFRDARD